MERPTLIALVTCIFLTPLTVWVMSLIQIPAAEQGRSGINAKLVLLTEDTSADSVLFSEFEPTVNMEDEFLPMEDHYAEITVEHDPEKTNRSVARVQARPQTRPRVVIPEREYDFLSIDQGEKIKHVFTIKNEGNANLYIRDVDVACGCTVVAIPKAPIKPGQSISLPVEFDSTGKIGKQRKRITLITNARPQDYELVLIGWVYPVKKKPGADSIVAKASL